MSDECSFPDPPGYLFQGSYRIKNWKQPHLVQIVNKSHVRQSPADVRLLVASFPQQSLDPRSDHSQFLNQLIKLNPCKPLMDQDFISSAAKTLAVAKSYQLRWQQITGAVPWIRGRHSQPKPITHSAQSCQTAEPCQSLTCRF